MRLSVVIHSLVFRKFYIYGESESERKQLNLEEKRAGQMITSTFVSQQFLLK